MDITALPIYECHEIEMDNSVMTTAGNSKQRSPDDYRESLIDAPKIELVEGENNS